MAVSHEPLTHLIILCNLSVHGLTPAGPRQGRCIFVCFMIQQALAFGEAFLSCSWRQNWWVGTTSIKHGTWYVIRKGAESGVKVGKIEGLE